jgi:hypothetical protein
MVCSGWALNLFKSLAEGITIVSDPVPNILYTPDRAKRLAFIRQLYVISEKGSIEPEPLSARSILTLHDAAELFLVLLAEATGATVKASANFLEYWEPIDARLSPRFLGHKMSMKVLSDARRGLKHSGVLPSQSEVERFSRATGEFLREGTQTVFDADFDWVSLVDLIPDRNVREELRKGEEAIGRGAASQGAEHARMAFEYAMREEPPVEMDLRHYAQWKKRLRPPSFSFQNAISLGLTKSVGHKFGRAWDTVIESVQRTENALRLMSKQINYDDYLTFEELIPHVQWTIGSNEPSLTSGREDVDLDDARWCVEFATQAAMVLLSRA